MFEHVGIKVFSGADLADHSLMSENQYDIIALLFGMAGPARQFVRLPCKVRGHMTRRILLHGMCLSLERPSACRFSVVTEAMSLLGEDGVCEVLSRTPPPDGTGF
jgi:hypothetical protein